MTLASARAGRPRAQERPGRRPGISRFAWYRSATRRADLYLAAVIDELLPGERSLAIPGVLGFIGCYVRQLWRGQHRPARAAAACARRAG